MSALLAAQSQASAGSTTAPASKSDALKDLFSQIDADGDGTLSKTEFENALGAGGTNVAQADDVFGKMDKDADYSVDLGEMMSALKAGKGHHAHHAAASDSADDSSSADGSSFGSADAGLAGRILDLGHQQRRFDHDIADLCRWLQGDDDVGRRGIQLGDIVIQFHRADGSAPGPGDFSFSDGVALGQRLGFSRNA